MSRGTRPGPRKVVVTGGAGFIGAHVTRALLAQGCEVVVVDDLSTGARANLHGLPVTLVFGSVTDRELLEEVCAGADSIVHLAARPSVERSLLDPLATHAVNATGTLTVLDVAQRGETHVVVVSSAAVYGESTGRPSAENDPPRPRSPYGASKLAAEGYALGHQASFGLPVLVVRLFTVFGPYQSVRPPHAAVVPAFIDAALHGRPVTVAGDGRQTRDFTYVETVAARLVDAVDRRLTHPGPVNLASGTNVDLLSLLTALEGTVGLRLQVTHGAPRPGDVRHARADLETMHAVFGSAGGPTDLRTALRATVGWYRARLSENPAERPGDRPDALDSGGRFPGSGGRFPASGGRFPGPGGRPGSVRPPRPAR